MNGLSEEHLLEIEAVLNRQKGGVGCVGAVDADEALARLIADGEVDAWDRFFDRYSPWAYRFAYRHLNQNHADAEDLCSDILLAAAKCINKYDPQKGELDAWVYGLARNRLARFCRKRRVDLPLIADMVDNILCSETTSLSVSDEVVVRDVVNQALASLPERQANALVAKYVEGCSTDELARRSQSTAKAMESLLSRARSAFRAVFNSLLDGGVGGGNCG